MQQQINNNTTSNEFKKPNFIIPPAEIRKIADKTAEFVAKNGPSFEELVIKAEANNTKFSFLKSDDPYRSYYDHKVSEFLKTLDSSAVQPQQQSTSLPQTNEYNNSNTNSSSYVKSNTTSNNNPFIINQTASFLTSYQVTSRPDFKREIKPPVPDQYSVEHPSNVTLLEIDIIKHTAQFVAKNGQKFLMALTEREKQNPQFEFLKPNHALFAFFTSLVDAYSKCIMPKREELQKLQISVQDRMAILNRVGEKFEYENMQKQMKKKKEEIDEEERMQMAQIDWNDFMVVETIDLFENEELPAPLYFDKNEKALAEKEKQVTIKPIEIEDKRMKPAINPPEIQPQPEQLVPLPIENDLKVKKNYVRKSGNSDNATVKCEVCGHNIPVNEYNEHLRIELMDPRHQQMKHEVNQRTQNTATASGEELSANLQIFSKKRPDIFGTVDDQFGANDKKKNEKVLWDGHSNTMTRTTANVAMLQQQSKKNIEETLKTTVPEKNPPNIPQKPNTQPMPPPPPPNSLNKTLLDDIKTTPILPAITEESKQKMNLNYNMNLGERPPANQPVNFNEVLSTPKESILNNLTLVNPLNPLPLPNNSNQNSAMSMNTSNNSQSSNNISNNSSNTPNFMSNLIPQITASHIPPLGAMKPPVLPLILDSSKLIKEENINLIPEEKWLELNPNHIQINIKIPEAGGEESWNFNGQVVQLEVDPRTTIGSIKDLLSGILGGMPQQKQKLKTNLFSVLKDNRSLAYYNMINGLVLELNVKERGGRARNK